MQNSNIGNDFYHVLSEPYSHCFLIINSLSSSVFFDYTIQENNSTYIEYSQIRSETFSVVSKDKFNGFLFGNIRLMHRMALNCFRNATRNSLFDKYRTGQLRENVMFAGSPAICVRMISESPAILHYFVNLFRTSHLACRNSSSTLQKRSL